jgi:hypothetical protein
MHNGESRLGLDPDVERRMFIRRVEPLPDKIIGHLTAEELDEFETGDRPVLLAVSRIEQRMELQWQRNCEFMEQARQAEAYWISKWDKAKSTLLWITGTVFVAVVGALAAKIFKVL